MIKKITIKDFEAHKETVLGFGDGLNVIHGKSNNGKSASLRALELAGYGVWAAGENKKKGINGPVRVGATAAEVCVESDKGSVTVRRGKSINEWEITNTDIEENFSLQNPGAGAIPQAQDVLGLRSVEIAGAQIRFNWSDQRDKHFLIDEVEGKNSSPSFVAGVLDEVGGLSGCEDLVRELASDKGSFEKKMKESAEKIQGIDDELEKFSALDKDISDHAKAEKKVDESERSGLKAAEIRTLLGKIENVKEKLKRHNKLESEIKATEKVLEKINKAKEGITSSDQAYDILESISNKKEKLQDIQDKIEKLESLDLVEALDNQDQCEKLQKKAQELRKISIKIKDAEDKIAKIPEGIEFRKAARVVGKAEGKINSFSNVKSIMDQITEQKLAIGSAEEKLKKDINKHKESEEKFEEIMSDLDICPTCGQEVTAECKAEIIEGV